MTLSQKEKNIVHLTQGELGSGSDSEQTVVDLVTYHVLSTVECIAGLLMQVQPINICNNKQLFLEFHSSERPRHVILVDDHSLSVTCTGNVAIKLLLRNGKTRQCHLSDVLYVPNYHRIYEVYQRQLRQEKELNLILLLSNCGPGRKVGIRK